MSPFNRIASTPSPVDDLLLWLLERALPIWSIYGVDLGAGGFFEKLNHNLTPVEEPRRARLVSRQIYLFSVGLRLGWNGPANTLINHGLRFLLDYLVSSDGRVRASCLPDGVIIDRRQYLYDVAFVLFALSQVVEALPGSPDVLEIAHLITNRLVADMKHPLGGYIEEADRSLQCANPHMHLFEAFLALAELSTGDSGYWFGRARDIAELSLTHMILPDSGALPEHFDSEWCPLHQRGSFVIEPGHQFEWSWLLARWAMLANDPKAADASRRLCDLAETFGVDPRRDVAFQAVDEHMYPLDLTARLWQQTERAKAWHAQALITGSAEAFARRNRALATVMHYLSGPSLGLWYEQMDVFGSFREEPVKASSGYHIASAIETVLNPDLSRRTL
jgi:mannose-6-phosphate isomerase